MSPLDIISHDLPEPVLRGIRDVGFVATTPIQQGTLLLALKGKDVGGLPDRRQYAPRSLEYLN